MNNGWTNLKMFLLMILITGLIYPLAITVIAQVAMSHKAKGDFIVSKGKVIGALLIGQKFESDRYFWSRPSAIDYNPLPSGGSNLGPTSALLKKTIAERKEKILKAERENKNAIPSELLFASGSGIDPHISVKTAYFQIDRVLKGRGLDSVEGRKFLEKSIEKATVSHFLSSISAPYVNVLILNKMLDESFVVSTAGFKAQR